jgi:hypothetical protein
MTDPHVVSLRYRLEPAEGVVFHDPPPVNWETDDFNLHLADGLAELKMKRHFATKKDARHAVRLFLEGWEIDAALRDEKSQFHFVFEGATLIDREPPPPASSQPLKVLTGELVLIDDVAIPRITQREYARPPVDFSVTPTVRALWGRYQLYLQRSALLLPTAGFCLSRIEKTFGKGKGKQRKLTASRLGIEEKILSTLGRLAATAGDDTSARKVGPGSKDCPLSQAQVNWTETTVKKLIRRVAQHASGAELPRIRMRDLPDL